MFIVLITATATATALTIATAGGGQLVFKAEGVAEDAKGASLVGAIRAERKKRVEKGGDKNMYNHLIHISLICISLQVHIVITDKLLSLHLRAGGGVVLPEVHQLVVEHLCVLVHGVQHLQGHLREGNIRRERKRERKEERDVVV